MSNKEWDKKSYNESYWAGMDRLVKRWEDLTKERPIEEKTYQEMTSAKAQQKKTANDIY